MVKKSEKGKDVKVDRPRPASSLETSQEPTPLLHTHKPFSMSRYDLPLALQPNGIDTILESEPNFE